MINSKELQINKEIFRKLQKTNPWFSVGDSFGYPEPLSVLKTNTNDMDNVEYKQYIFAHIFGSFNIEIDLDKAKTLAEYSMQVASHKLFKFNDIKMNQEYIKCLQDYAEYQVLLGTIYSYKDEYIKASYHFMKALKTEKLNISQIFYDFIKGVIEQLVEEERGRILSNSILNEDASRGDVSVYKPKTSINDLSKKLLNDLEGSQSEVVLALIEGNSLFGILDKGNPSNLTNMYKTVVIDRFYNFRIMSFYFKNVETLKGESKIITPIGFRVKYCSELFDDYNIIEGEKLVILSENNSTESVENGSSELSKNSVLWYTDSHYSTLLEYLKWNNGENEKRDIDNPNKHIYTIKGVVGVNLNPNNKSVNKILKNGSKLSLYLNYKLYQNKITGNVRLLSEKNTGHLFVKGDVYFLKNMIFLKSWRYSYLIEFESELKANIFMDLIKDERNESKLIYEKIEELEKQKNENQIIKNEFMKSSLIEYLSEYEIEKLDVIHAVLRYIPRFSKSNKEHEEDGEIVIAKLSKENQYKLFKSLMSSEIERSLKRIDILQIDESQAPNHFIYSVIKASKNLPKINNSNSFSYPSDRNILPIYMEVDGQIEISEKYILLKPEFMKVPRINIRKYIFTNSDDVYEEICNNIEKYKWEK